MTFRDRPGLTWRLPPTWLLLTALAAGIVLTVALLATAG